MGALHAIHTRELEAEQGLCRLVALADTDPARAEALGLNVPVFASVDALAQSGLAQAVVIATPTHLHREHATRLLQTGHRVLMEKPLTGNLKSDLEFAAQLDRDHPHGVMLALQRRFDAPLQYARELMADGVVGRVFKIYSALEDSNPAPNGYVSGGILPDMSVHNVDEILWLTDRMPVAAASIGSRIYSHRLTTSGEDFDDALLYLWFEGELTGQVQVSRNHVSGYRVETIIFGEEGQIHVGHFDQKPRDIQVEVYGRRGRPEPLALRTFSMRDYGPSMPEFVDRFGPAYKSEVAIFVDCCRANQPFPATHRDAARAQQVIAAGQSAAISKDKAAAIPQA